jgi:hypothetical protein
MSFVGNHRQKMPKGIAYSLIDYCELVDSTERYIRENKAVYIDHRHSPILERLGINSEQWFILTNECEQHFSKALGSKHMLQQYKNYANH